MRISISIGTGAAVGVVLTHGMVSSALAFADFDLPWVLPARAIRN
jgi:hypothetical protein